MTRLKAPKALHAKLALWLTAALSVACSWEPVARPVRPERVLAGPARVVSYLDRERRYVLVELGEGEATRQRVFDAQTRAHCELPEGHRAVHGTLIAPGLRGDGAPTFLLPMQRSDQAELVFVDERCAQRGPLGVVDFEQRGRLETLPLRTDGREVLMALERSGGALVLVDPWSSATRVVSPSVLAFQVVAPGRGSDPLQAVWTIEGGRLAQRALDGQLLLSLGEQVQAFAQSRFEDGLRVAYEDGEALFEAKGPAFSPQLIADRGCEPRYRGTALDLYFPCSERQLVRIELTTGAIRRFAPGVVATYPVGTFELEQVRVEGVADEFWLSGTGLPRTRITPTPDARQVTPLGASGLVGRTRDGRVGVWSVRGEFVELVRAPVRDLWVFPGARANQLLWLMLHDVAGELARLSAFDQVDVARALSEGAHTFAPEPLAEGVPLGNGLRVVSTVGTEPIVLTLEHASRTGESQPFAGTLHARLLSGALDSVIDEGVSSQLLVTIPQPAIVYGIAEGARSGLWFAAL